MDHATRLLKKSIKPSRGRLNHCTRSNTSRTNSGPYGTATGGNHMNFFQIRQPAPTSFIIRMGNIIPGNRPFSTNLTYLCHHVLLTLLLSPLSLDQQAITTKHNNYPSYVHNYLYFKNRFLYPFSFLIATFFLRSNCQ